MNPGVRNRFLSICRGPWTWALAALCLAVTPAQAQNLLDLFAAARSFDAAFRSAQQQLDATVARAEQARAGTLPNVGLALGLSRTAVDVNVRVPASAFGAQSATVSASHPLYRPVNWLNVEQGRKSVAVAQAQLQLAEQDLTIRVAQAYFDVLAAQDALAVVQAQKSAVEEQLASARRNFEVGTSTITDTREAQARFDLVRAQEIAADNDLRVRRLALDQLTGLSAASPKSLAVPVTLPAVLPADVGIWVDQALEQHPVVRQSTTALDIALLETRKAQAGNRPTLDLNGSVGITHNNGSASSAVNSQARNASIALAFNLPLFAGYAIQNRVKETLALEEKARSDLEAARRSVAQATRAAYFGVLSGQGQARALEAAEASSQSALEANQVGYRVGVRINIDVLNAQSQLFQTRRDLARARYDVLLGGLKLRQASGTLTPQDLQAVNGLLVP